MADKDYARLRIGGLSLVLLIPGGSKRGRPKGSKDSAPRKRRALNSALTLGCAACGQLFTPQVAHSKFCSAKCRNRVNNRNKQDARRDSGPRACNFCGEVFSPAYGSRRRTYCTTACRDTAKRKVRSGSSHRRRAEKYGGDYQRVSKLQVFERDGWKCYLCGCDTPKVLSGTREANAPELEHVIPLSAGGPHSYENVRCACRRCNRAKGVAVLRPPHHGSSGESKGQSSLIAITPWGG